MKSMPLQRWAVYQIIRVFQEPPPKKPTLNSNRRMWSIEGTDQSAKINTHKAFSAPLLFPKGPRLFIDTHRVLR
jgi:hypothetical protein